MAEGLAPGDLAGAETLELLSAAPRYNAWQYQVIAPYLGRRVLEVGSGIGNISEQLLRAPREQLVLTDTDPWYREQLARRFGDRPEVTITELTLPDPAAPARLASHRLDTVVALNVVEHIEDDVGALRTMRDLLVRDGRVVVLVPAHQALYGELDRVLGHFRRYDKVSLGKAYQRAGLVVEHLFWFNRVGTLGWWFHGRVRRVKRIPPGQLKTLNALVPLLRLERFLPLPFGQSVIAVGTPA